MPTPTPEATVLEGWTRISGDYEGPISSSAGFVAYTCSGTNCASETYSISQDGVTWTPLPMPSDATRLFNSDDVRLFTSDGLLMAFSLAFDGLTTWKWTDGNWTLVDGGPFDRAACGAIDSRDPMYLFGTGGKTVATVGQVNWQPTSNGWKCASGPSIAITTGHGLFVGSGATAIESPADFFWRSDDGLTWRKTQDSPEFMRITAVKDGFVAVGNEGYNPPDYLYTSSDGMGWSSQALPFGDRYLEALASDGNRAVTVEDEDNPGTKAPGAVWVSSEDGIIWTRYPLPPRSGDSAYLAAILGNRVVVAGSDANGTELVWSRDIP